MTVCSVGRRTVLFDERAFVFVSALRHDDRTSMFRCTHASQITNVRRALVIGRISRFCGGCGGSRIGRFVHWSLLVLLDFGLSDDSGSRCVLDGVSDVAVAECGAHVNRDVRDLLADGAVGDGRCDVVVCVRDALADAGGGRLVARRLSAA